ncbi:hypothetical protein V6C03_01300 [Methyloligella sp. 2.7D]|uniref:hypothetical protein n=1 Tax=unclassified Methyloligella TaxID=2625955 RepID=UPI00157D8586|nr:hypothetical protein [Methyloligella sp. GL2]QKP76706.1 hypothetical protein HT051_04115 [Methyloligella sp. GL2]
MTARRATALLAALVMLFAGIQAACACPAMAVTHTAEHAMAAGDGHAAQTHHMDVVAASHQDQSCDHATTTKAALKTACSHCHGLEAAAVSVPALVAPLKITLPAAAWLAQAKPRFALAADTRPPDPAPAPSAALPASPITLKTRLLI